MTMKINPLLTTVFLTALVSGCTLAEEPELEGITLAGGNAVAHNSSLQIIDPWPAGVQDTDLNVPAEYPDVVGAETVGDNGVDTIGD